jgi:tetratricopeptide (TPR) repeat protein
MRHLYLVFIFTLISCLPQQDRIIVPVVNKDFYSQALSRIDADLKSDDSNLKLVQQKLYYCDLLNWPVTCIDALDGVKSQEGMTPVLLEQYISYYKVQKMYPQLLEVIDRWGARFNMEENYRKERILGLVKARRIEEASISLRNYLVNGSHDNIPFAASCFLEINDTIMASYYLNRLSVEFPNNDLVLNSYPDILFKLGYHQKAFEILERKAKTIPDEFAFHSELSSKYEFINDLASARKSLVNFIDSDSVVYRIADLYLKEEEWDSAHQHIDILIERDSLDRDAWFKKATMYEDRGWLSYSLNYFDHLIYLDPNDSIAHERAELVRRKIAYLQRLKFEENKLPLREIESKKLIDNE